MGMSVCLQRPVASLRLAAIALALLVGAPNHGWSQEPTPQTTGQDQSGQDQTGQSDENQTRARKPDDQSELHRRIEKLGEPEPPTPTTSSEPTPTTPGEPPIYGPPEHPPPYTPERPPPPYTFERTPALCCARVGNRIFYPITSDPLAPAPEYEAPNDPAVGAIGVYLHDGAFFTDVADLAVKALFYDINWTRHWRSDVSFDRGGELGGWDFAFNRRIVPVPGGKLANGLEYEQIGTDTPTLWYYNGLGRAEKYVQTHSEERKVENFDGSFTAWVTTYKSPPGQFHEIERYVVISPPETHPFRGHPNVEPTEQLFYVLRDKEGTRYVFNCRGQLIYILSRNDSRGHPVRVELDYGGKLSPLTQNPTLTQIIDAKQRKYAVTTVNIDEGSVFTFYEGQTVSGKFPIPRIKTISSAAAGVTITYNYQGGDKTPILETVETSAADAKPRKWKYVYDGQKHITDIQDPNTTAGAKATGKPLHIDYSGQRVSQETIADQSLTIGYDGPVKVTNALGDAREYTLQPIGGYHVVQALKVIDAKAADDGGPWITKYEHNGFTQITELTYPAGNGQTYEYENANAQVTVGPIRDWKDRGLTYESNLAEGNLLGITRHGSGGAGGSGGTTSAPKTGASGPTSTHISVKYDKLYNQPIEEIDVLGGKLSRGITDYTTPKNRGNPLTVDHPPVGQPVGGPLPRPTTELTYNADGQVEKMADGGRTTNYGYDPKSGALNMTSYPGGDYEVLKLDGLGNALIRTTQDGPVKTDRNGLGQVTRKVVDPLGLALTTTYDYDNDGNIIETKIEVKDNFGQDVSSYGGAPEPTTWRTVTTDYDVLGRKTKETTAGGGLTSVISYAYTRAGDLESTTAPALDDVTPLVTHYRYDARGLLSETIEAYGTSVARTVTHGYDANGHENSIRSGATTVSMHYDGLDKLDSSTDLLGATQAFVYDAAGEVTDHTVTGKSGVLQHATFAYDGYGHVIRREAETFDSAPQLSQAFYSPRLLLVKTVGPNGSATTYDHDEQDRVTDVTDAAGDIAHNDYDGQGRLTFTRITANEQTLDRASGELKASPKATTTTTTYDAVGRVTAVTTPQGTEKRYLNSLGQVRVALSRSNQATVFFYDGLGRQKAYQTPYSPRQELTLTKGGLIGASYGWDGEVNVTFDPLGRPKTRTDNRTGGVTKFVYADGKTTITDPNGTTVVTTYNALGQPLTQNATLSGNEANVKNPDNEALVSGFRIVRGAKEKRFVYDELGRLVEADSGYSQVRRKYDGIDRVTEETQVWSGTGQRVSYEYADDFKSETVIYPELTGKVRLQRKTDAIGRVELVSLNSKPIAQYYYTGLDRVAARSTANGVETRFGYDDAERLNHLEIAGPGKGPLGETLWSATAAYDATGLAQVTEVFPGRPEQPGTPASSPGLAQVASPATPGTPAKPATPDLVYQTSIQHDPIGQPLSITTSLQRLVTKGGANLGAVATSAASGLQPKAPSGVLAEVSGTINKYEGGHLSEVAEFNGLTVPPASGLVVHTASELAHAVGFGGDPVRAARVDKLTWSGGRISSVSTTGGFNAKLIDALNTTADVAALAAKGDSTASGAQAMSYDANGNLVFDGRYLYGYNYDNQLVTVQDIWSPYLYSEAVSFTYDALGRRIQITPTRDTKPSYSFGDRFSDTRTWLVYDDQRVIAEYQRPGGNDDAAPTLIAEYFHGARPGEILRMDRTAKGADWKKAIPLYLHEDMGGVLRFATNAAGEFLAVQNTEPLTPGQAATGQSAGDANMVGDTNVRLPYIGADTRIDGFAGTNYRELGGMAVVNYRAAHSFLRKAQHQAIAEARLTEENKLQIVAGIIVALPIGASYIASSAAPLALLHTLGSKAFEGAVVNVGFGGAKSWLTDQEYTPSSIAGDALQGAAFGLAMGGVGQMGLSGAAKFGVETAAMTAVGTTWDVGVHGSRIGDAFLSNLAMSVAINGAVKGIGAAGSAAKAELLGEAMDGAESAGSLPEAVAEETHANAAADPGDPSGSPGEPMDPGASADPLDPQSSVGTPITPSTPTCACNPRALLAEYVLKPAARTDPSLWHSGLATVAGGVFNAVGRFTAPIVNWLRGARNCAACTIAFDLYRRYGVVTMAKELPPASRAGNIYRDMERLLGGKWESVESAADVEARMATMGQGEGGVLYMAQAGRDAAGNMTSFRHVFNIVKFGGRVYAIDMQRAGLGKTFFGSVTEMLGRNGYILPDRLDVMFTGK
jgi:YD repeat-containing protein